MASLLGPTELPLVVPTPPDINDAFEVALADYLAFWIRTEFSALSGAQRTSLADACPANNVFVHEPAGFWVRNPTPALYVWQPDESESRLVQHSTVYDMRERVLRVMYVWTEIEAPAGLRMASGISENIDAICFKASARGYHPGYGYGGSPLGTPLHVSLAPLGAVGWRYTGGRGGFLVAVPETAMREGGSPEGYKTHGYPALLGSITVVEKVLHDFRGEADKTTDILVTMNTNEAGDLSDTVTMREGYLPAPPEESDA